jgi:hypothetical protein
MTSQIEDGYGCNTAIISFIARRKVKVNQGSFNTFLLCSSHYCLGRDGTAEMYPFACRLSEFRTGEVWQPRTWKQARSENTRLDKEYRTATHYSWTWRLGPDATYKIIKLQNVSVFVPLLASVQGPTPEHFIKISLQSFCYEIRGKSIRDLFVQLSNYAPKATYLKKN